MMDSATYDEILKLIMGNIENKLKKITKEADYSPFFKPLFTSQVMLQASILHSFYTSFGTVYEGIARILGEKQGYRVENPYHLAGAIDPQTEGYIAGVMQRPATKATDIEEIRRMVKTAPAEAKDRDRVVDVYIQRADGVELLFDITTVKPSKKEFEILRLKMLRWCALRFSTHRDAQIETYIGIPFNPDAPKPYRRWTGKQLDISEVLVQNDLWAKFAGYDVFPELVKIFEAAGEAMRSKIDAYMSTLKSSPK